MEQGQGLSSQDTISIRSMLGLPKRENSMISKHSKQDTPPTSSSSDESLLANRRDRIGTCKRKIFQSSDSEDSDYEMDIAQPVTMTTCSTNLSEEALMMSQVFNFDDINTSNVNGTLYKTYGKSKFIPDLENPSVTKNISTLDFTPKQFGTNAHLVPENILCEPTAQMAEFDAWNNNFFEEANTFETQADFLDKLAGIPSHTQEYPHYMDCVPGPSHGNRMNPLPMINFYVNESQHSSSENEAEPTQTIEQQQHREMNCNAESDWEGDSMWTKQIRRRYSFVEQEITESDLEDLANDSEDSEKTVLAPNNNQVGNSSKVQRKEPIAGPSTLKPKGKDQSISSKANDENYEPLRAKVKRKQKSKSKQQEKTDDDDSDVDFVHHRSMSKPMSSCLTKSNRSKRLKFLPKASKAKSKENTECDLDSNRSRNEHPKDVYDFEEEDK